MTMTPAARKKNREKKLKEFDPNKYNNPYCGLFGLPFETDESDLVILPVPWDLASEKMGSAEAPDAILNASKDVNLYKPTFENIWQQGIALHNIPQKWKESSIELRKIRNKVNKIKEVKISPKKEVELVQYYKQINNISLILKEWVEDKCNDYLDSKKVLGLLGGDKSVISGFISALAKKHKNFGILHLDAHAGMKEKYNGFEFLHESVIRKHLQHEQISSIVIAGTRSIDFSEIEFLNQNKNIIRHYSDAYLKEKMFKGTTWRILLNEIISPLPRYIYISIDIDVLQQWLCPYTAKPEPGGFTFEELLAIITEIQNVGKKIIGFDLTGISPSPDKNNDWDSKVGAELLYHLCCNALLSQRK